MRQVFARRRVWIEWLVVTSFLLLFAGAGTALDWLRRLDNALYDFSLTLHRPTMDSSVAVVAIDDASLARLGRWPWSRAQVGELVDRLRAAGARVVALDLLLAEPSADDGVLALALARLGQGVLPLVPQADGLEQWLTMPVPALAQAAQGLGHTLASPDSDGVVRGFFPRLSPTLGGYPHFSLAALAAARSGEGAGPSPEVGGTAGDGTAFRRFIYPEFPREGFLFSAANLLGSHSLPAGLKGKVVFLGVTALGVGDFHAVPMTDTDLVPGVEVQAALYDALAHDRLVRPLSLGPAACLGALLVLGMMLVLPYLGSRLGLLAVLGCLAVTIVVAVALPWLGWWWSPGATLLALGLSYPIWNWRRLEAAEAHFRERWDPLFTPAEKPASFAFDRMAARIAAVEALQDRMAAIRARRDETLRFLSHDLRAPLASIISLVELAEENPRHLQEKDWFATLRGASLRSLHLAEDFLHLSRAEALDPKGFERVDLYMVLSEAMDDVWPLAQAQGGRIDLQLPPEEGGAEVLGEAAQLRRAFVNLLSNGVQHGQPGAPVRVRVDADAGDWVVTVSNPVGRPEGPAPSGASVSARPGSLGVGHGLGLQIVAAIVLGHGGHLTGGLPPAGSPAGRQDVVFQVRLPAASAG